MKYEGTLYRPPSEAYSLIIQVTIGCAHNKCTFCNMYREKQFRIRKKEEIIHRKNLVRWQQNFCWNCWHMYMKNSRM